MGSNFYFKNFVNDAPPPEEGGAGRPPGNNFLLTRQPSIYSMTFDELQNTMGGVGKDFGSMNMDELLKNIWNAEEIQAVGSAALDGVPSHDGYLQRQGSLTLPRTLSLKTVDEVWRDMSKDIMSNGNGIGSSSMTQKQQTLGEVTLEEFLVRAGVVREDAQLGGGNFSSNGFFEDSGRTSNNQELGFGYQQGSNQIPVESVKLPSNLNLNGTQQMFMTQQAGSAYNSSMSAAAAKPNGGPINNIALGGIADTVLNNNPFVQNSSTLHGGGGLGMVGLAAGSAPTGSPSVSLGKSNGDVSSVSPAPYAFNGGLRGRKSSGFEKVVERRQKRMIKNRESAARSRARKQAYTMELEAEVAKLKEENQELRKKQAEMMEIQKKKVMEMTKQKPGAKRRCLRRTVTGPW